MEIQKTKDDEVQVPGTASSEAVAVQPEVREDEAEDGEPILDEEDLEENDLTEEDLEDIEWEEPKEEA